MFIAKADRQRRYAKPERPCLCRIGARPIKRMIQKELLNELSKQIIAGSLETGKPQVIDVFDGKIVLRKPIDEKEKSNGNGKAKKSKAEEGLLRQGYGG